MKEICDVREFTGNEKDTPVKEMISKNGIPEKNKILQYLKSFEPDCASGMTLTDEVTGNDTDLSVNGFEDGTYFWDTRHIYHFEKYNLKLNNDFIKHVLSR